MSDEEYVDEPGSGAGEDGEDVVHIELTPEQREALRRMMKTLRGSITPKITMPSLPLPEVKLRSVALPRFAETQRALVASTIQRFFGTHAAWQKELALINSDIFKSHALAQSNLNLIASQLTRNIDFGIGESAAKIAAQFATQQASWLRNIGPVIASMHAAFYPPNLRAIDGLTLEEIEQVVMVDGIPLYGVPRTSTAEALIRADGVSSRRDILGRRWKTISDDCRDAVKRCLSEAVIPYVPFALAAIDALDAGHTEAAQALAGSLVDATLSSYFGEERFKYTPDRKGKRTKDAYDEFTVRQFIAFAPMWQAYQQFFVADGDKVPTSFSRNATAHTVSRRQFNRRNAVQGIMIACSLLLRFDEEAAALEAED